MLVLIAEAVGIKISIKITVGIYFLRKYMLQDLRSRARVQESV